MQPQSQNTVPHIYTTLSSSTMYANCESNTSQSLFYTAISIKIMDMKQLLQHIHPFCNIIINHFYTLTSFISSHKHIYIYTFCLQYNIELSYSSLKCSVFDVYIYICSFILNVGHNDLVHLI